MPRKQCKRKCKICEAEGYCSPVCGKCIGWSSKNEKITVTGRGKVELTEKQIQESLSALKNLDSPTATNFGKLLKIPHSYVAGRLQLLEEKGWVYADKEGRGAKYYLSDKGEAKYYGAEPVEASPKTSPLAPIYQKPRWFDGFAYTVLTEGDTKVVMLHAPNSNSNKDPVMMSVTNDRDKEYLLDLLICAMDELHGHKAKEVVNERTRQVVQ